MPAKRTPRLATARARSRSATAPITAHPTLGDARSRMYTTAAIQQPESFMNNEFVSFSTSQSPLSESDVSVGSTQHQHNCLQLEELEASKVLPQGMCLLTQNKHEFAPPSPTNHRKLIQFRVGLNFGLKLIHVLDEKLSTGIEGANDEVLDKDVQKYSICIDVPGLKKHTVQKYASHIKDKKSAGNTRAKVARQVAEVLQDYFEKVVTPTRPDLNVTGLGGPGLTFDDLFLVALAPLSEGKRMYQCVLGYYPQANAAPQTTTVEGSSSSPHHYIETLSRSSEPTPIEYPVALSPNYNAPLLALSPNYNTPLGIPLHHDTGSVCNVAAPEAEVCSSGFVPGTDSSLAAGPMPSNMASGDYPPAALYDNEGYNRFLDDYTCIGSNTTR